MVLGEDHLGLVAPHHQRLVEILRPWQRLANLGAAQRIGVVQRVGRVLGGLHRLLLLDEPQHLGGCLGPRRHQELVGEPVDDHLLPGLGDEVGRRDQRDRAGGGGGAEPGADLALRVRRQQVAVHVARTPAHGGAGHDVLGDCRFQEAVGRVDLRLAGGHVLLGDDATHAAIVIDMAVGVDHRLHRLLAAVGEVEVHSGLRRLLGDQRVDDGDPLGALDDGHVREVLVADLIDAVRDLEEPADVDELGVAPQARVHSGRCIDAFLDEVVLRRIPDDVSGVALDDVGR